MHRLRFRSRAAKTNSSTPRRRPKHRSLHRVSASAFSLLIASVFVFTFAVPALAMGHTNNSRHQQLETEASSVRGFIDKSSDKKLHDKNQIREKYDSALERNRWQPWDRWSAKKWQSCNTVYKLTALLDYLGQLKERYPSDTLEELYTLIWMLRNDILQSLPADKPCRGFENVGSEPVVKTTASDNKHVALNVAFSTPQLATVKAQDQTFTRLHVNGIENMVGEPGEPAIPKWRQLVALPEGATPKLTTARAEKGSELKVNLVPFQDQPLDQASPQEPSEGEGDLGVPKPNDPVFADKPFKLNERTYQTDRTIAEEPCKVTPMGQYRDVHMAQLECALASYNPVTDKLTLNKNVSVDVAFEGGADNFITSRTLSPFEDSAKKLTTEAVVNKAVLSRYVKQLDISVLPCQGEEFLILTHSTFREAADRLADHKRAKGMSTSVFNVGSGVASRDTAEEIDDFIEDRYDDCKVRPSYVMLMGDAEFIPTFYPAGMADNAGSDFPYSNYVQILFDAFFPDFGTGRVPVDTLAQANTVVDKIVNYEASPPYLGLGNGAPFYNTAGFASQFQCCRMNADGTPLNNQAGTDQRAFVETSELARQELLDRGYNVPRIYTRTTDGGGYCIQENANGDCIKTQAAYSGDATPRRYFNGSLLPAGLGAGSGFAWSGSAATISNAWNAGRFLFLHRDHGGPSGWGNPGFSSSNVDALSNGDLLPVVWSVNCASGMFDNETAGGTYNTTTNGTYFAERALRKADGGAVGVIGDTRNSPTWANNALTRGFFDAVWPNTLPNAGSNTSHKRLGDILNWGKIYLASQVGVGQTAGSVSTNDMGYEYHIWHVIGDPTLEMWTNNPYKINLSKAVTVEYNNLGEILKYPTNGASITQLQTDREGITRAIGRATVVDGKAEMRYFERRDPSLPSSYSASLPNAVSVQLSTGDDTNMPRRQ
jgi:hypothetical protein